MARPVDDGVYRSRLEAFHKSDKEREEMVEELIRRYNEIRFKYDQMCGDYDNEVQARRHWYNESKCLKDELETRKRVADSSPIVFAIIDGDGALFRDDLVNRGEDGGADAAHKLQTEIKNHLKQIYAKANVEDWNIVVQVVLNMEGLSKKLHQCGIVKNYAHELPAFARAFGRSQPLFSVVDVGAGKEQADHKIREMLRLMVRVAQCKHIIFGPCHDNGYLPVLEPYKRDPVIASKLTLLETTPAEPGFLSLGLKRVSFPDIFRSEPLPSNKPSTVVVPQRKGSESSASTTTLEAVPTSTWAALGKTVKSSKAINITSKKPVLKYYYVNANNERLDSELPRTSSTAEKRFSEYTAANGKCCNNYYLLGSCDQGQSCPYQHSERLSAAELLVLKHKARSIRCPQLSYCTDVTCYLGHVCKFGKSCGNYSCRWADTHHVDTTPAAKVFEDGTRESLSA